jgi:hypothetical protein
MKKQTGIWIDTERAIIVSLKEGKEEIKEIQSEVENRIYHEKEGDKGSFMGKGIHHVNSERTFEERKDHQFHSYLEEVVENVKNTDELFVFGPSEAKIRLRKYLENEKSMAGKLKAVEPADKMTNHQIVAKVKEYYSH